MRPSLAPTGQRIAQLCIVDVLIASLALSDYDAAVETIQHTFDVLSIKRC